MSMHVRYYNDKGTPLNIEQLQQGEDITTEITIKNTGLTGTYQELALNYPVPSGFEIINDEKQRHARCYAGMFKHRSSSHLYIRITNGIDRLKTAALPFFRELIVRVKREAVRIKIAEYSVVQKIVRMIDWPVFF